MLLGSEYFILAESSLTSFSLNGTWTHITGGNAYTYDWNEPRIFEVGGAESFPEQSVGYCWVKGIHGENNLICTYTKTPCLLFWGCHQRARPTNLYVYLKAKLNSMRALGCPVLQLCFCIRPFAKLSPAVFLTKGSLNPPSWRTSSYASV